MTLLGLPSSWPRYASGHLTPFTCKLAASRYILGILGVWKWLLQTSIMIGICASGRSENLQVTRRPLRQLSLWVPRCWWISCFFLTYSKSTENASYVSNLYDRAWMNRKQLRWGGSELVASIVVPSWGHSGLFFFRIGNIILWRIYVTRRFQVHQYLPSAHQLSLQGNQATRLPCAAPGSLVEPKKNPNRIPSLKLKWSPQKTNVCKINLSFWGYFRRKTRDFLVSVGIRVLPFESFVLKP